MSAVFPSVIFGLLRLVAGAAVGGAAALAVASALPNPNDGSFAMKQRVICLPLGALVGLLAGIAWGASR